MRASPVHDKYAHAAAGRRFEPRTALLGALFACKSCEDLLSFWRDISQAGAQAGRGAPEKGNLRGLSPFGRCSLQCCTPLDAALFWRFWPADSSPAVRAPLIGIALLSSARCPKPTRFVALGDVQADIEGGRAIPVPIRAGPQSTRPW